MASMTVAKKFFLTTGGLITALATVGGVAIYNLASLNKTTQLIINDPLPGIANITGVRATSLMIRGDVWRHIASSDSGVRSQLDNEIQSLKAKVGEYLQAYDRTSVTREDRELLEKVKTAWARYSDAYPVALELSRSGKSSEAVAAYNREAAPVFDTLKAALGEEVQFNQKRGEMLGAESQQSYGRTLWVLGSIIVLSIGGGATLAFLIVLGTTKTLQQIVSELAEGADQTARAASQISSSSQSLAQGSTEQAASLEETSASSEEINSMARKNTENSREAADLVTASQQRFLDTNQSL